MAAAHETGARSKRMRVRLGGAIESAARRVRRGADAVGAVARSGYARARRRGGGVERAARLDDELAEAAEAPAARPRA